MGTWGYGIFENDVSVDVRLTFEDAIHRGATVEEATRHVLAECADYLEDMDDRVQVWLALASLQLEQGSVEDSIRKRALEVIEQGADLKRWEENGTEAVEARKGMLEVLRSSLLRPAVRQEAAPRRRLKKPKKLPYEEGTWFAVPLRDGGYGVGIVARIAGRGVTLGYFFGPRRSVVPNLSEVETLTPDMAILVEIFGDLGLIEGRWPIIGRNASWDRRLWPIPGFGRIEEHTGRAFRMELSEDDLFSIVREIAVPRDEAERLPKHGLSGAGSVESVLARLLDM